jgi:hypothetical protein
LNEISAAVRRNEVAITKDTGSQLFSVGAHTLEAVLMPALVERLGVSPPAQGSDASDGGKERGTSGPLGSSAIFVP